MLGPTNFSFLIVPGCPSPFFQFQETAVLCVGFPSLSYRLESASLEKARVILGLTSFLFCWGSAFYATYCWCPEHLVLHVISNFLVVSSKRDNLVMLICIYFFSSGPLRSVYISVSMSISVSISVFLYLNFNSIYVYICLNLYCYLSLFLSILI